MSKAIVYTSGDFMLKDPNTKGVIPWNRPAVVSWSSFIETRMGIGQIKLLATDLPEAATDEAFHQTFENCDRDVDLAVSAFKAEFEADLDVIIGAITQLEDKDFQKDGKPKVGALNKILVETIDAEKRDKAWEAMQ